MSKYNVEGEDWSLSSVVIVRSEDGDQETQYSIVQYSTVQYSTVVIVR